MKLPEEEYSRSQVRQLVNKAFLLKFLGLKLIPGSEQIEFEITEHDDRPRLGNCKTIYREKKEIRISFLTEDCSDTGSVKDLEREYVQYLKEELYYYEELVRKEDERLARLGIKYSELPVIR